MTFTGNAGVGKGIYSNVAAGDVACRHRTNYGDADYTNSGLECGSNNDNSVGCYHDSSATNHSRWRTMKEGTPTYISDIVIGSGAYHIYENCRYVSGTNTAREYLDDVQVGVDTTTNVPTVDLNAQVSTYNAVTVLTDWILLRKYTLNKPTLGVWGSEEPTPTTTPTPTPTPTDTPTPTPTPLPGDLNSDGKCNILDVVSVCDHWGETGAAGWIPEDIHQDGVINILDIVVIGDHWTG